MRKKTILFLQKNKRTFYFELSSILLHPLDDQKAPVKSLTKFGYGRRMINYTQLKILVKIYPFFRYYISKKKLICFREIYDKASCSLIHQSTWVNNLDICISNWEKEDFLGMNETFLFWVIFNLTAPLRWPRHDSNKFRKI